MVLQSGFGLTFHSEIAIPGTVATAFSGGEQGAPIRVSVCRETIVGNGMPEFRLEREELVFAPREVGEYRIGIDRIEIALRADADPELVGVLLVATALPALLWMRGHMVLHAAGLAMPGGDVVAIAGASGSGKSSLAQALLRQGARLIGDDSLDLQYQDWGISIAGLPGGYYLGEGDARSFQRIPPASSQQQGKLAHLVVLEPRGEGARLRRVVGVEAVAMLLEHRHRPQVPALLGLRQRSLAFATELVKIVPVFAWSRRMGDVDIEPDRLMAMIAAALSGDEE